MATLTSSFPSKLNLRTTRFETTRFVRGRFLAERIFRGFLFLAAGFFSRIFSPGFFLLIFVGKKCPEKSSTKIPAISSKFYFSPHFCGEKVPRKILQKIPGKILQILYHKNPPTHFCRLAGARFANSQVVAFWGGFFLLPERPFTGVSGPSGPEIEKKKKNLKESLFGGLHKSPRKYLKVKSDYWGYF